MICIGHSLTHQTSVIRWWPDTALLAFDYLNNRYMVGENNISLIDTHDVTRTSDGYFIDTAKVWALFPPNIARRTNAGLFIEPDGENLLAQSQNFADIRALTFYIS